MPVTAERLAGAASVRSFRVDIPDEALEDLRRRIGAMRWPDKQTVDVLPSMPGYGHFNKVEKGGHFAGWEEPQLFATEIWAAFRSVR